jgi:Fe-S cluster biogenesis protein NfuA
MSELNTLEAQIQAALDEYRPNLYMDGGDVEVLRIDDKGVVHLKMMGACIDCPISLLTMKLGIQRLLKEKFPEQVRGVNAITDVDISALYNRSGAQKDAAGQNATGHTAVSHASAPMPMIFRSSALAKPAPVNAELVSAD